MSKEFLAVDFSELFQKALYRGFVRVAQKVRSRAKTEYCPVVTGNLRASIVAPEITPFGTYPVSAIQPAQATYAGIVHERNPYLANAVADVNQNELDTCIGEGFESVFS